MIKVKQLYQQNRLYGLEIKGHANQAPHGEDLICAAVSAIVTGGWNSFEAQEVQTIELKEGYAKVEVNLAFERALLVLHVIVTQLKTIEANYPQYIKLV